MSDIIQLLPDHVANQIAAGEVVQRPASVAKELLENAIDANAKKIKLIIKDAGKSLLQVIDNGQGMSETDARLCFERHATSKIKVAEDLLKLNTKGFRGEALASIAAIAHVSLKTKQDQEDLGVEITIEGSQVIAQEATVTPKGTSVSVKNLFFNIPARRNFLKSNTVELRHITDEFHRVALSHPTIAFKLFHNGNQLFNLPPEKYRQRIVHIFGAKTNEKLVPVSEETEVVTISGFIGKPQFSKKTRSEQFFFVNHRFIKSPYLHHAINTAFEGLLKPGYQPSYFLHLNVNPKTIDINIHPTKTEIKFDDEHSLYAILRAAVKHSLGQFNITPILDFENKASLNTPYNYKDKPAKAPTISVDKNFNPFISDQQSSKAPYKSDFKNKHCNSWESLYVELKSNNTTTTNLEASFEGKPDETFWKEDSIETAKTTFQLHKKYIVTTLKSGLLFMNQNRAHQRVLYENYLKQLTLKAAETQQLLFPLTLDVTTKELEVFKELETDLKHAGFLFSDSKQNTVKITGVPLGVLETDVTFIFEQLLSDFEQDIPKSYSTADVLAKSLAKSTAIKNGQVLSMAEQEHLVNSLFACKAPNVSPSNKLTFVTMTIDTIEKQFI